MNKYSLKTLITCITLLLIISLNNIQADDSFEQENSYNLDFLGNIFFVGGSGPNNYTLIQNAIDNASNGDTVFVMDDSSPYYENLIVDKQINLIGEDKNNTIIDGNGIGDVVSLYYDKIVLSGFSIINNGNNPNIDSLIKIFSNNIPTLGIFF